MDYEKAYKAVLKTATQWIKDGCTDKEKICLECVFPQLRESEDERIRKDILRFLKAKLENCTAPTPAKSTLSMWIDYLEKQKEQEHICDSAQYEEGFKTGLEIGLRKQKEQKPIQTENEREYVKTLKGLVSDFIRNSGGGIVDTAYYQQIYDWLDGRNVEQNPAWSEEDERRIDAICELLENTSAIHPNYSHRKLIIWLKSLRPSWKPSEEQMKALDKAIPVCMGIVGKDKAYPLVSLYEQLKKL